MKKSELSFPLTLTCVFSRSRISCNKPSVLSFRIVSECPWGIFPCGPSAPSLRPQPRPRCFLRPNATNKTTSAPPIDPHWKGDVSSGWMKGLSKIRVLISHQVLISVTVLDSFVSSREGIVWERGEGGGSPSGQQCFLLDVGVRLSVRKALGATLLPAGAEGGVSVTTAADAADAALQFRPAGGAYDWSVPLGYSAAGPPTGPWVLRAGGFGEDPDVYLPGAGARALYGRWGPRAYGQGYPFRIF